MQPMYECFDLDGHRSYPKSIHSLQCTRTVIANISSTCLQHPMVGHLITVYQKYLIVEAK